MNRVLYSFIAILWSGSAHSLDSGARSLETVTSARQREGIVSRNVSNNVSQPDVLQGISGYVETAKMVARAITLEPNVEKKLSLFAAAYRVFSRRDIVIFEKELKRLGWRMCSSKRKSFSKKNHGVIK